MTYELEFTKTALKKFDKLNPQIAEQFIRKLETILDNPKIPKNKLSGSVDLYKVKLRSAGYRQVYQVIDAKIVVLVLMQTVEIPFIKRCKKSSWKCLLLLNILQPHFDANSNPNGAKWSIFQAFLKKKSFLFCLFLRM